MEDIYVTAGNQERGWNDPPQFSYRFQVAQSPQRNLLTRRAAPPGAPAPPPGQAAPPLPPRGFISHPPQDPRLPHKNIEGSQLESEPDLEGVVLVLNRALEACRQLTEDQVCKDVAKRLRLLEDSWKSGRLSVPVRRRMNVLAKELQSGQWDSADEIHRSLMVDHVTEVSQWMVGVKRLIAETRRLNPELLNPLQNPADCAEPAQDQNPADCAEPAQDQNPADCAEPAQDQNPADCAEPAQGPAVQA
ncbi:steroid receptor RNA activator 1 [Thalassophryne amazonica]|uniref:steroid receptor RNA activator 1 n=1 Tax=Thalassophryne amazonica TaxID=390379 RepID=UPI0014713C63|nr:steroid receptor RNA activator 1 [Thalassophryne amazonica]